MTKDFYTRDEAKHMITNLVMTVADCMINNGIKVDTVLKVLDDVDQRLMDKIFGKMVGE